MRSAGYYDSGILGASISSFSHLEPQLPSYLQHFTDDSPALQIANNKSFEHQLAKQVQTHTSDSTMKALIATNKRRRKPGPWDDVTYGFDPNAGKTLQGPHVHSSLTLSSSAYRDSTANYSEEPRLVS